MFHAWYPMRLAGAIWLAALAVLLLCVPRPAAAADPLQTAQQILAAYNLITTGNVSTNSDVEGPAVIGGNLTGGTFFNAHAPSNPAIYLYGSQSGNLNLNSGGSLYMNGAPSGLVNYNGGGHLYSSGPPVPLSTFTAPLTTLSSDLAQIAQTVGNTIIGGTFNAVAGLGGMSVFDITGAELQNVLANANINFNLGAGVTGVVVNVTGSFIEPNSTNWNVLAQAVLFNFVDATSVTVGNWQASILAPNAKLSIANGAINGAVFAKEFLGGGEIHFAPFSGEIVMNEYTGTSVAVPEPATLWLLGLGFAATTLLLRPRHRG
jgi:choice-of-anchor A domain-containing protein